MGRCVLLERESKLCLLFLLESNLSSLSSLSSLGSVSVHLSGKGSEEVDQGEDVGEHGADGETRTDVGEATLGGTKLVPEGQDGTDPELSNLHRGQVLLAWRLQSNRSRRIVSIHDGVNERVEGGEDPDRVSAVVVTHVHGDDGASVVIGLQERRTTALEKNDDGVDNLVVLGEIEVVRVVTKAIPEGAIGIADLQNSKEESGAS